MIINISRASTFQECRQKTQYQDKERLRPWRTADPLLLGGSYHKGLAHYFSTDDIVSAALIAEQDYRTAYEKQEAFVLPEEHKLIERHATWLANSLAEFAKHYKRGEIQVIQPEVEFCVPLPGTEHFCKFMYCVDHPEAKQWTPEQWNEISSPGFYKDRPLEGLERYIRPHYFRGKTDAVVEWQGKVWLFEHKTEARTGDTYFNRFLMDFQPTGYLYGIRESTGMRPSGFVLNIIKKPNAQFKGDPLSVIGFEREAYLRSDADLERFAIQLGSLADDYETAFFDPRKVYMNTKACTNWNRKCDFMDICLSHGERNPDQFQIRPQWDYVEAAYYQVLGLPVPPNPDETLYQIQPAQ